MSSSSEVGESEEGRGEEERDLEEEENEVEEDEVEASEERRDRNSLLSFLASLSRFSRESMCILYSRFTDVSFVIFCSRSWFSDINPFVLSSRSLMYSFLRCRERAADCLFFNNLSCLFRVLSSSDLNSTLNLLHSLAAWISDAEAASNSNFSVGLIISIEAEHPQRQGGDRRRAAGYPSTTKLTCYDLL
jgi:hypothetical protein